MRGRRAWWLFLLPPFLLFVSLGVGRFLVPPGEVVGALLGAEGVVRTLVLGVRLPRALAAACVGANLSVAGAAFQGLFRNPLVESRILGVSSGAACGASVALLCSQDPFVVQGMAFGVGLLGSLGTVACARRLGTSLLVLVIAGILVGTGFDAILGLIKYVADPLDTLPAITYWLLGGLGDVRWGRLWPLFAASGIGLLFFYLIRWRLNLLSLAEPEALSLGVPVRGLRFAVIFGGTLLTAAAVSTAGIVGWVGLIVPHAARGLVGPDHARLIPASMALGASTVLLLDLVARTALPSELPLGVLTGLIGVPVFFGLFLRTLRTGGGWR